MKNSKTEIQLLEPLSTVIRLCLLSFDIEGFFPSLKHPSFLLVKLVGWPPSHELVTMAFFGPLFDSKSSILGIRCTPRRHQLQMRLELVTLGLVKGVVLEPFLMVSGVILCTTLYACCFLRRRFVSEIA